MNLSLSLHQISPMKATSILSRFLAYEIAVPISQPEKTLEFQNYKLIFFIYLYLLFSLNVVNELSRFVSETSVRYRCFSNGLQRYALFLYLQTFLHFFLKNFAVNHFRGLNRPNFTYFSYICKM